MFHIFISEATPKEKQRKLLRFAEGINNYQGLYASLSDDSRRILLAAPLYYTFAGAVGYNAASDTGFGGFIWSSMPLDHLEYAYRFTLYNDYVFAAPYYLRIHNYSLWWIDWYLFFAAIIDFVIFLHSGPFLSS